MVQWLGFISFLGPGAPRCSQKKKKKGIHVAKVDGHCFITLQESSTNFHLYQQDMCDVLIFITWKFTGQYWTFFYPIIFISWRLITASLACKNISLFFRILFLFIFLLWLHWIFLEVSGLSSSCRVALRHVGSPFPDQDLNPHLSHWKADS